MTTAIRPLERADEAALRRVMETALEFDRFPGFTAWELEQELVSLLGFTGPEGPIVAEEDGFLCGYVSPRHDDLTVDPSCRRRGHGRRLLEAAVRQAAAAGGTDIALYAPAEGPGRAFAEAMGMRYRSSLWRMDLPVGTPVPGPSFPEDIVARIYGDWLPLPQHVALLNDAFASHPTPVSWTVEAVAYAQARPDFDPSGTLLVCPAQDPERPVGFVRAVLAGPDEAGRPGGEIRVVGVLPEWRRRGLGRELLRWGVARLREQGVATIQLTVEAENEHALELYRRTGFEPAIEWPHWTIATGATIPGV